MAKLVSVVGQKGGCGKTSTLIIMASMLAYEYKKKVLVLDCDTIQQTISKLRELDLQSLERKVEKNENGEEYVTYSDRFIFDEFYVKKQVPAYDLEGCQMSAEGILNKVDAVFDDYDYILLDLPGTLDNRSDYFKIVNNLDVVFLPFSQSLLEYDSQLAIAQFLHENILKRNRLQEMYYFWLKFVPNVRVDTFNTMHDALTQYCPEMKELENKMLSSQGYPIDNNHLRNTLIAPIGPFRKYANIMNTVDEMCKIIMK